MVWFELLWDGENDEHIAEHGLTIEDVEYAVENSIKTHVSRSSGRPMIEGYTPDGRVIMVVFEYLDDVTIYPVTAYEVER